MMRADEGAGVVDLCVDGIELRFDRSVLDDYDLAEAMGDVLVADEEGDSVGSLKASTRFMRTLLGKDYKRVKELLRSAGGGTLTSEDMAGFCNRLLEAAKAKN